MSKNKNKKNKNAKYFLRKHHVSEKKHEQTLEIIFVWQKIKIRKTKMQSAFHIQKKTLIILHNSLTANEKKILLTFF